MEACAVAPTISLGETHGDNIERSGLLLRTSCGVSSGSPDNNVWRFVAPTTGVLTVELVAATYVQMAELRTSCPFSEGVLGCATNLFDDTVFTTPVVAGEEAFLVVVTRPGGPTDTQPYVVRLTLDPT